MAAVKTTWMAISTLAAEPFLGMCVQPRFRFPFDACPLAALRRMRRDARPPRHTQAQGAILRSVKKWIWRRICPGCDREPDPTLFLFGHARVVLPHSGQIQIGLPVSHQVRPDAPVAPVGLSLFPYVAATGIKGHPSAPSRTALPHKDIRTLRCLHICRRKDQMQSHLSVIIEPPVRRHESGSTP